MKDLDHVARPALPWRVADPLTECGRVPADVSGRLLSFDEFRAKFAREGQQRSAMTTCMTCWNRAVSGARLNEDWAHRPSAVIAREVSRGYGPSYDGDRLIDRELRALAALAESHADEFSAFLAGLEGTVSLAERRGRKGRAS